VYVGDPHLGSVEYIPAIDLLGRHLHADYVRAGRVLRHGERANLVSGDQAWEVLLLLFGRAVEHELVDAELGVGGVGETDASYSKE
jgi:hypothetical protein